MPSEDSEESGVTVNKQESISSIVSQPSSLSTARPFTPPQAPSANANERAGLSQSHSLIDSRNLVITGGQFHHIRGHHTSLVVHINQGSPAPEDSGSQSSSPPSNEIRNISPAQYSDQSSQVNHERPENRSQVSSQSQEISFQKSNDIYERHLVLQGRGFPLWIPDPNQNLHLGYRRTGVRIGDVGIITDSGAFSFLFNICLPHNDPVNPRMLPEHFAPISPPIEATDIEKFKVFKNGSHLASASVRSQTGTAISDIVFESSATEGAILTMPRGARSEKLGDLARFREYQAANIANWYRFVNGPRGREAKNGDVRLVVGFDKTTSWGIATFANQTQQNSCRLKFGPSERDSASTYTWSEYSGGAVVRAGPDSDEIDELRIDGDPPDVQFENQCLFVRTLNATLADDIWADIHSSSGSIPVDPRNSQYPRVKNYSNSSYPHSNNPDSGSNFSPSQGAQSGTQRRLHGADITSDKNPPIFVSGPVESIAITAHPSKVLNDTLLAKIPTAKMVITHDDDWSSVTQFNALLNPHEFVESILASRDIHQENGVVFLEPKNTINEAEEAGRCEEESRRQARRQQEEVQRREKARMRELEDEARARQRAEETKRRETTLEQDKELSEREKQARRREFRKKKDNKRVEQEAQDKEERANRPSEEEFNSAQARIEHNAKKVHIAICGSSDAGKSSLINAFRGFANRDPGAAPAGKITTDIDRYPDARVEFPYSHLIWFDLPGAETLDIPDWQYFNKQGLFIFDVIVLVYDRFTKIDEAIIQNCDRYEIPLYIVRSKADMHIRNIMADIHPDSDEEIYYKQARQIFVDSTRGDFEKNLQKAQLTKRDVFIVSSIVIRALVTKRRNIKISKMMTRMMIDEARLLEAILEGTYARLGEDYSTVVEQNTIMWPNNKPSNDPSYGGPPPAFPGFPGDNDGSFGIPDSQPGYNPGYSPSYHALASPGALPPSSYGAPLGPPPSSFPEPEAPGSGSKITQANTETLRIAPPISVRVATCTSIPAISRQLGSASSSAPLMPALQDTVTPIVQGARNIYPTITTVNYIQHASNADANEQLEPRMDDISENSKTHDRARAAPLEAIQTDSVGYEKWMTTKATLHRDGKVVVTSSTTCHDLFHGLRGRILIVLRNINGDAIGVTDKMCCTTRGGLLDLLTPYFGDDTFSLEFPREVASLAVVLDIWQGDDASVKDVLSWIHEKAHDANIAIAHHM